MPTPTPTPIPYKLLSLLLFLPYFTLLPWTLQKIWPLLLTLPFSNTPLNFYIFIAIATNTLVFGIYNLVMWYVYRAKIPFFERYRLGQGVWEWEAQPEKWRHTLRRTLKTVLFNLYVLSPIFPILENLLFKISYKMSLQQWPSQTTTFLQFLFFLCMQDLTFYWSHTLFHKPVLYPTHKAHHSYTQTIALAATYAHPLQFILGNIVPTGIGYLLLARVMDVHFCAIVVWLVFRLVQGSQVHGGYDWPWRQMAFLGGFKLGPREHGRHHERNVGNFGSMFRFWDWVMGTQDLIVSGSKTKDGSKRSEIKQT